ncbi:Flp pilus assembly complex ATPase component [bacterium]|nr:Flp pilus assembly complex ATPase component [bacterium]
MTTSKDIAEILFDQNKLDKDQLNAIRIESVNTGKSVENILQERNLVTSDDLIKAKSFLNGFEYFDPSLSTIPNEILDLVSESIAKKSLLIPFDNKNGVLSLAMVDPLDLPTIELIERRSSLRVKPFMASSDSVQKAIASQYGKSIGKDVSEALGAEDDSATKLEENLKDVGDADKIVQDSSVARVVSIILEYAVKVGASDVHIEPGETSTRVRYRVDGILQEKLSKIPRESHDSLVARIKILANLKIDEKRKPQDGRFKIEMAGEKVDLRISIIPTVNGEKVVIRLLKDQGNVVKLKDLGLRGAALRNFDSSLLKPNGIILVTGPTGSGKTLTLATALRKLNSVRVNIMTLEDPVEIRVPGINQIQINPDAGLTFASGLRSFLRQDPNVIMVGEIRDSETANLAVQAALTGHLVLATLHTNSAAGSIPRLLDMKVENFLLSSTINTVLAQRLVRNLCPYCKVRYDAPEGTVKDIQEVLGKFYSTELIKINASVPLPQEKTSTAQEQESKAFDEKISELNLENADTKSTENKINLYRGEGCDRCNKVGYLGRVGIYEVLNVTDKISSMIAGDITTQDLEKEAIAGGMMTLKQDGFIKALEGITSLEEVLRVASE